ncbi:MAG: LVIVD repeat-containing protein [Crocinitomicaceae bacterium]
MDHWYADSLIVSPLGMRYNECWGFDHNGEEYAMIGSTEGTHFFQIDNQGKLNPVDFVEGNFSSTTVVHRDYKTYRNYIYGVCDEGISSLQIMDISSLPDSVSLVVNDSLKMARAHNIYIDTANALMYACTVSGSSGGTLLPPSSMRVYSLSDPLNPTLIYTGPNDIPEVHDAYVRDNIAYLNCGFDGLRVYDFANPSSPIFLQNLDVYQEQGYNHQGWLSPDGSKYVFADESNGKKIKYCEVANNQVTIQSYFGTNFEENSVPHNIVLSDRFAYVAYYNEGLRIYDMNSFRPFEVAHFDTHPEDEGPFTQRGAWGVYAQLPSGRIIVSDRKNGLFLFDFEEEIQSGSNGKEMIVFSNPLLQGSPIVFRLDDEDVTEFECRIVDMAGRIIHTQSASKQNYLEINRILAVGAYTIHVSYEDYLGDPVNVKEKIIIY